MDVTPSLTFMTLALQREHTELASIQAQAKSAVFQIMPLTKDNSNSYPRFYHLKVMFQKLNGERAIKVTTNKVLQFESRVNFGEQTGSTLPLR